MNEEKSKIFISYSRKDKDFALRLAEDLRAANVEIWIDQLDIPPGVRWDDAVEEALDLCKSFMVILSPVSVESKDVKDEIAYALDAGKQIIPVLYQECKIPLRIRRLNYIDVSSDYSTGKTKIIETIKKDQPLQTTSEFIKLQEFKKVIETPPKKVVPKPEVIKTKITVFRSNPQALSEDDVKSMLKKFDFFCIEENWSTNYCNPTGKGFKNDFVLQKDRQVVYDRNSDLIWQQSGSDNYMDYEDAKKWITKLNKDGFAGFNDWRLPTLEEAMSLMESERKNNLYIDLTFDREQKWIWTADQVQGASGLQWAVSFRTGECHSYVLGYYRRYVRAVRSG